MSLNRHKDMNTLNRKLKTDIVVCKSKKSALDGEIRDLRKMNLDLARSKKKLQEEVFRLTKEVHKEYKLSNKEYELKEKIERQFSEGEQFAVR